MAMSSWTGVIGCWFGAALVALAFGVAPVRAASRAADAPPGASGLRLLVEGDDALAALLALADGAERSLDLKYYAVLNDTSSRVVLQRVRAAADRGVRVRLLIDDLNATGADDALLRLTRHPRIEVRLYNPMPRGRGSIVTKVLGSLGDAARINSRMHGKAFIADGTRAVSGGRNLGDPYFLRHAEANFIDLDLLIEGPVVQSMAALFERFWASALAQPVTAVAASDAAAAPAPDELDAPARLPEPARAAVEARVQALRRGGLELTRAPARLIADLPSKSLKAGEPDADETMFDDLRALLRSAERDVLIVSPYFVPGADGLEMLGELRRRGVRVRVLTASFAGTDAPVAHLGYGRYRQRLLGLGVELFELRPEYGAPAHRGVHSRTNLHSKAIVVDGRTVLVGSMNVDPRSARHNTEMGLLVRSPALAAALLGALEPALRHGAYRVARAESGGLRWIHSASDGRIVERRREPDVPLAKLIGFQLLAPLAPEQLL